jgi:hypothetical protein
MHIFWTLQDVAHIVITRLLDVNYRSFNACYIRENVGDTQLHKFQQLTGKRKGFQDVKKDTIITPVLHYGL